MMLIQAPPSSNPAAVSFLVHFRDVGMVLLFQLWNSCSPRSVRRARPLAGGYALVRIFHRGSITGLPCEFRNAAATVAGDKEKKKGRGNHENFADRG